MNEGWCQVPSSMGVFADAVTKGTAPDLHENMLTAMPRRPKTDPTQHLVAMAMKATRPLATYPMIFTKVWAIAQIMLYSDFLHCYCCKRLGHTETAAHYAASSLSYWTLYDAQTGFMRARSTNGTFKNPSPTSWEEIMQNALQPRLLLEPYTISLRPDRANGR